jgi:hypothetical protein
MAKITIQRIFDATKALATEAGQSLQDFINFQAQFAEITLRALRNGLTYSDNMDCDIRTLKLSQNASVAINLANKRPTEIRARRVLETSFALAQPLQWGFTANGKPFVVAVFSPVPTTPVEVEIIILY